MKSVVYSLLLHHNDDDASFLIGTLRCGLPPLTVLTSDLQQELDEFGVHMGLQLSDIEHIKQKNLSQTVECCLAVCSHWLDHNMEATWNDLLNNLHSISLKWNSIASGLYQYLNSMLLSLIYLIK